MQIQAIRTLAKAQGITTTKMDKPSLIRAIQRQEGNFDCFGSALNGFCDQGGCLWREDCMPAPAVAKSATESTAKAAAKPAAKATVAPAAKTTATKSVRKTTTKTAAKKR